MYHILGIKNIVWQHLWLSAALYIRLLKLSGMPRVKKINTLFDGKYTHHWHYTYPSFSDVHFEMYLEVVNYISKTKDYKTFKEF